MAYFRDPTLAELLSDPMTRTLMHADGVDHRKLETSLRELAAQRDPSSACTDFPWRSRAQSCGAR